MALYDNGVGTNSITSNSVKFSCNTQTWARQKISIPNSHIFVTPNMMFCPSLVLPVLNVEFLQLKFHPVLTMCIPGKDVNSIVIHPYRQYTSSSSRIGMCNTGNAHPYREWGCASRECTYREFGCASPGMHILTGNGNVPHRKWGCASLGMHILTGNAHSSYRAHLLEQT